MAATTRTLPKGGKSVQRTIDPMSILLGIAALVILGLLILDLTLLPTGNKTQPAQAQTSGQQVAPAANQNPADKVAPTVIPTADTSNSYGDY